MGVLRVGVYGRLLFVREGLVVWLDLECVVAIALTGFWSKPLGYEALLCGCVLLGEPEGISIYAPLVGGQGDIPVRGCIGRWLVIRGLCVH